jgi:hypothetical protein
MEKSIENILKNLVKDEKIIPVIGAGVSKAVAGLPNWKELLIKGLNHAEKLNLDKDKIRDGRIELDNNKLLSVGQTLKELLGRNFKTFLKYQLDSPEIKDYSLLDKILDINAPFIITTNYDNLFYKKAKLDHITGLDWLNYEKVLKLIELKEKFIFHIHGFYENIDSIVLSNSDYKSQNDNDGYSHVIREISRNYHFLFIGCSQDGILDEGFMLLFNFFKKWFPNSENEHFFLAINLDENTSKTLIDEANICALSYGIEHKDLPDFLNKITPNPKKRNRLILERLKAVGISLEVKDFDKNSERLNEFKGNLIEYIKNTDDNKNLLSVILLTIKKLSKSIDYEKALGMWNHMNNIKKDDIPTFIHIAVQSNNLLGIIPDILINDLQSSRIGIHEHYFDGYLTRFIQEYEGHIKIYKEKYIDHIQHDKYLFENLHRIIRSLKAFINLKIDDIYPSFSGKFIRLKQLKEDALIVVTNKAIYFRSPMDLNNIYASCSIRNSSNFSMLESGQEKTIFFMYDNALFGFSVSDPNNVLPVFSKSVNRRIENYLIKSIEEGFLIKIFHQNNWLLYLNKALIEEHYYSGDLNTELFFDNSETYYVSCDYSTIFCKSEKNIQNAILVSVSSNIREKILIITAEQVVRFFNIINQDNDPPKENKPKCIRIINKKVTKWLNKSYLIVEVDFDTTSLYLLFFNISSRNDKVTKYIKLKKGSICYEIVNGKDLLIGYLDTTDEENLCDIIAEFYPDFMTEGQSQLFFKDKSWPKHEVRDILSYTQISSNEFWLNVEGIYLYQIDTYTGKSKKLEIDLIEGEKICEIIVPNL